MWIYIIISNLFGIGHSRVCIIISNVSIKSTVDVSLPKLVFTHTEKKTLAGTCGFENLSGFLQKFVVVNSCHIRTNAPLKDADNYIS